MKNRACCWILAILGIILLVIFVGGGLLVASVFRGAGQSVALSDSTYIVIELSGRVAEHRTEPSFNPFSEDHSPVLSEILRALEHAKTDDKIIGVILKPTGTSGFADLREIRERLKDFKAGGKPVYAYLEIATDRDYYLASVADSIVMVPSHSGGMVMLGLSFARTYKARTFDKVGLKFNVLHMGEYKGTYEDYAQDHMSDQLRESLQQLTDGLFDTYVSEMAADRNQVTRADFEHELLHGEHYLISGEEARTKQYVDLVMDWQTLKERLHPAGDVETVSVRDYLKSFDPPYKPDELAVVFAEGGIEYSDDPPDPLDYDKAIQPESFIKQLKKLRDDDDVKAVVLRVNSPGGSSLASELILQEVRRLQAAKPVVVSMGNVAASGGYYIACGADYIFAQPNTVTGSIGVVSVVPTAEELYNKIEARVETVEKGKWSQFIRFDKNLTDEQRAVLLDLMQGIYDDFVEHVAEGRKMSVADVEASASGRIWTGNEAVKRNLVNEIGGLSAAIEKAAELARLDVDDVRIRFYPKESDLFTFLMERFGSSIHALRNGLMVTPDERQMLRAIEFLKGYFHRRDFVQTLAPIDVEF